jgi:hypothetical protein
MVVEAVLAVAVVAVAAAGEALAVAARARGRLGGGRVGACGGRVRACRPQAPRRPERSLPSSRQLAEARCCRLQADDSPAACDGGNRVPRKAHSLRHLEFLQLQCLLFTVCFGRLRGVRIVCVSTRPQTLPRRRRATGGGRRARRALLQARRAAARALPARALPPPARRPRTSRSCASRRARPRRAAGAAAGGDAGRRADPESDSIAERAARGRLSRRRRRCKQQAHERASPPCPARPIPGRLGGGVRPAGAGARGKGADLGGWVGVWGC